MTLPTIQTQIRDRLRIISFSILSVLTIRTACAETAPLKIGVIQSTTGIAAEDGRTVIQALQLAAEEINQAGSNQVTLIVEDDQSDAKQSVAAYKKLLTQRVDAIIGPTWSFTANAVLPFAADDKMVLFNTSSIPECLTLDKSGGYGYSTATSVAEQVRIFGKYLFRKPVLSSVIVYTKNSWGEAQYSAYKAKLLHHNVRVLDEIGAVNNDANDWSVITPRIRALEPELVVLLLNKGDLDLFLRRSRELGLKTQFFASYRVPDALRLTSSLAPFEGVCFPYPGDQHASAKEFNDRFKRRFGEDPKRFADSSYDAIQLLVKAEEIAQKRKILLNDALREVDYTGIAGRYRFTPERSFSIGKASLMCVKEGTVVVVP